MIMSQKQNIGIIKTILKKINKFFIRINPRYQLSFDDDYWDNKEKERKYRFKSFGDHGFPEFTFKQIKLDASILCSINPHDLIKISEKNYYQESSKSLLRIEEFLQNNEYKVSNNSYSNILSGEEICDNPLLFEQITKNDLFKIAYNTGFKRGRKLSKLIFSEQKLEANKNNVLKLKVINQKDKK